MQSVRAMDLTLKWQGKTGDGKLAFVVAEQNDGWRDLRIEVDTDDCDSDFAKQAMQIVIDRVNAKVWQPMETMPKSGSFLIGVWEGEWREPRQNFRVYEASGFSSGPVWGQHYRTAEGESYEVVGWMEKPLPPGAAS